MQDVSFLFTANLLISIIFKYENKIKISAIFLK